MPQGRFRKRYQRPSLPRVLGALILAPLVPALLVGLFGVATGGDFVLSFGLAAFMGLFYGLAPGLILGLPAYFLLRGRIAPNVWSAVLAGALIASLPIALLLLDNFGLETSVSLLSTSLGLGAVGGLTFWLIALRGLKPLPAGDLGGAGEGKE